MYYSNVGPTFYITFLLDCSETPTEPELEWFSRSLYSKSSISLGAAVAVLFTFSQKRKTLYQSFFQNNGFLSILNNISLLWNTDGIPVFKSTKSSLWPMLYTINELPFFGSCQTREYFNQRSLVWRFPP